MLIDNRDEKLNRIKSIITIIRDITIAIFFILLSIGIIIIYPAINKTAINVKQATNQANILITKLDTTRGHLDAISERVDKSITTEKLENIYNDWRTSIDNAQITAQGYKNFSDALAIATKKGTDDLHVIVSELTLTNQVFRDKNLPSIVAVTDEAKSVLSENKKLFASINNNTDIPIIISNTKDLLASTNTAIISTNKLITTGNQTLIDLNLKLPITHDLINTNLTNVAGMTFEFNKGLHNFNQPLTKKQKIVSFFTKAVLQSAPVLLRR